MGAQCYTIQVSLIAKSKEINRKNVLYQQLAATESILRASSTARIQYCRDGRGTPSIYIHSVKGDILLFFFCTFCTPTPHGAASIHLYNFIEKFLSHRKYCIHHDMGMGKGTL